MFTDHLLSRGLGDVLDDEKSDWNPAFTVIKANWKRQAFIKYSWHQHKGKVRICIFTQWYILPLEHFIGDLSY